MKRIGVEYSRELCPSAKEVFEVLNQGFECPKIATCGMSHNRIEQLFKDEYYKTKFCSKYPNDIGKCEYGRRQ